MPPRSPWGGDAWGGSRTARPGRPPGFATVPGYDTVYYWTRSSGSPGWGQATWSGRGSVQLPSAGLLAAPDVADGTVTVQAWWAYAEYVTITRIDADGSRVPVRASPIAMPPGSRRNQASNPKARDALTGYTAGSNTTMSRLTDQVTPVDGVATAVRAAAAAAGTAGVTVPDPVGPVVTGIGFLANLSAAASDLRVSVTWYDGDGTSLGAQTYPVTAGQRAQAATGWTWCPVVVDSWPSGAASGQLVYEATGLPAGATFDLTARLIEPGAAVGDYFDGDRPGASWIGAGGLSASDLSPIVVVVDAEAPLDVPARYELTSARAPGYAATSEPVTLGAGDLHYGRRQCLMTHPGLDRTIRVWVEDEPEITNDVDQTAFKVSGRRRKVVVSESERSGDEGELTLVAETFEERDRLLAFLDDGSPLLLRFPAFYGHPPLWWLSFGKVSIEPQSRNATRPLRRLKVPFIQVDRPSAATRALVA